MDALEMQVATKARDAYNAGSSLMTTILGYWDARDVLLKMKKVAAEMVCAYEISQELGGQAFINTVHGEPMALLHALQDQAVKKIRAVDPDGTTKIETNLHEISSSLREDGLAPRNSFANLMERVLNIANSEELTAGLVHHYTTVILPSTLHCNWDEALVRRLYETIADVREKLRCMTTSLNHHIVEATLAIFNDPDLAYQRPVPADAPNDVVPAEGNAGQNQEAEAAHNANTAAVQELADLCKRLRDRI
jgi:hypothetical protein